MPLSLQDPILLRRCRRVLLQWRLVGHARGLRVRVRPGGPRVCKKQTVRQCVDHDLDGACNDIDGELLRIVLGSVRSVWWNRLDWCHLLLLRDVPSGQLVLLPVSVGARVRKKGPRMCCRN